MENNAQSMMTTTSIKKLLFKFGIPSLIGLMANALHNTIDIYFLGTVGVQAVAAVGIAFPLMMAVQAIGLIFGSGAASLISRDLGAHKQKEASQVLSSSVVVSILVSSGLVIVFIIFLPGILRIIRTETSLIPMARTYLLIVLPGAILGVVTMVFNNATRAEGSPFFGMISVLSGALLNIILDYILIIIFQMGVAGAAWATLIALAFTSLLFVSRYILKRSIVLMEFQNILKGEHRIGEQIQIGLPAFIFQLLTVLSLALLNALAAGYGSDYVAGVTVVYRIITLSLFIQFGFAKGVQPIIGFNWGAGLQDRVKKAVKSSILILFLFGMIFAIFVIISRNRLVELFVQGPSIPFASSMLFFQSIFLPLGSIPVVLMIYFMAIGKAKETAILSLARQGLILIPAVLILNTITGLWGLTYSPGISDGSVSLLGIIMLLKSGIIKKEKGGNSLL
jgi:putative MATE family efflux protein